MSVWVLWESVKATWELIVRRIKLQLGEEVFIRIMEIGVVSTGIISGAFVVWRIFDKFSNRMMLGEYKTTIALKEQEIKLMAHLTEMNNQNKEALKASEDTHKVELKAAVDKFQLTLKEVEEKTHLGMKNLETAHKLELEKLENKWSLVTRDLHNNELHVWKDIGKLEVATDTQGRQIRDFYSVVDTFSGGWTRKDIQQDIKQFVLNENQKLWYQKMDEITRKNVEGLADKLAVAEGYKQVPADDNDSQKSGQEFQKILKMTIPKVKPGERNYSTFVGREWIRGHLQFQSLNPHVGIFGQRRLNGLLSILRKRF